MLADSLPFVNKKKHAATLQKYLKFFCQINNVN